MGVEPHHAEALKDNNLFKNVEIIGGGEALLWKDEKKRIEIDISCIEFYRNGY